ncbi:hypothetical protein [Gloeothece verrucosa]|uniref:Lymphocyte antigen 75 n=1 Tax=Gloeothece verrucosa (strain PCC 7822) TaxID=497965 RepID=E0U7R2_GLOV7|nr:hypothetical protein [Gloeothece verrucosa]ADN14874.1 lymphocyte antigen 75 [Gloeothece verrucosa PCC 7822]
MLNLYLQIAQPIFRKGALLECIPESVAMTDPYERINTSFEEQVARLGQEMNDDELHELT